MTVTVGVDIGGTSVRAMAFDEEGTAYARSQVPTAVGGGEQVIESVLEAWSDLALEEVVDVAGVGVPGRVDPATGDVRLAVNLGIGDDPYPLGPALSEQLGVPVTVENDVKVAALGIHEALKKRNSAPTSLVLLNIGTGISAGVVIEGNLYRGSHGMAGEIGHVVVDELGAVCACGQTGCLEAVAAGPAIARLTPNLAPNDVATQVSRFIAEAITWIAATFDPEKIYLGGGVSQAGDTFLDSVRGRLREVAKNSSLAAQRIDPNAVTLAPIDGSTGPRGAAVLAQRAQANRILTSFIPSKATSTPTDGGEI
ncbi:MAG TPA: ROK family protein [Acidimicrobiia bacterium]|nr:ROK family protein [Acidimicrobiia bacterium]